MSTLCERRIRQVNIGSCLTSESSLVSGHKYAVMSENIVAFRLDLLKKIFFLLLNLF